MPDIISAKSLTGQDLPGFISADGQIRLLASLPNPGLYKATPFGAANPIIPRSEWKPFKRVRNEVPILDQGQVGSCNAHGFASALMRARVASGQSQVLLSASMLYALINGGRDAGSAPEDAAKAVVSTGICLDSEVPEGFYRSEDIGAGPRTTAARFKVPADAMYQVSSFDELVSALMSNYRVAFTVRVAGNWNQFDANGSPPFYRGQGNHVTCDDDSLAQLPSGEWVVPSRNSWTPRWGNNGRYNFREAASENQSGFVGYAVKFPGFDPLDPFLVPSAL